jgi:hypothetical protein
MVSSRRIIRVGEVSPMVMSSKPAAKRSPGPQFGRETVARVMSSYGDLDVVNGSVMLDPGGLAPS